MCNEIKTSSLRTKDEHLLIAAPLPGLPHIRASKRRSTRFDCEENWDNNTSKSNWGHSGFLGSKDGSLDFASLRSWLLFNKSTEIGKLVSRFSANLSVGSVDAPSRKVKDGGAGRGGAGSLGVRCSGLAGGRQVFRPAGPPEAHLE